LLVFVHSAHAVFVVAYFVLLWFEFIENACMGEGVFKKGNEVNVAVDLLFRHGGVRFDLLAER
jgi:hypothetical protein